MFIRQQSTQTASKIQCWKEKIVGKVGGGKFLGRGQMVLEVVFFLWGWLLWRRGGFLKSPLFA